MSYAFDKNKILDLLHAAFADEQYPGDDNIVEYKDGYEYEDVYKLFKGKKWQEFKSVEDLYFKCTDSSDSFPVTYYFSYLLPEAYRYYFPSTIKILINTAPHIDNVAGEIEAAFVNYLNVNYRNYEDYKFIRSMIYEDEEKYNLDKYALDQKEYASEFDERHRSLGPEKSNCVAEFLVYIIEREERSTIEYYKSKIPDYEKGMFGYDYKYEEARLALNNYWAAFLSEQRRKALLKEGVIE